MTVVSSVCFGQEARELKPSGEVAACADSVL